MCASNTSATSSVGAAQNFERAELAEKKKENFIAITVANLTYCISIFSQAHYSSVNQKFLIGHFNYLLHSVCRTIVLFKAFATSTGAAAMMFDRDTMCDVSLHKGTSVAFGDFINVLLPLLDAKRIDLICRFHFNSISKC